jgi:tetratricopeptide (TPR) repeat protein
MRLKAISLLLLGVLSILTPELRAQSGTEAAADRFLNAYQLYQKGDALEGSKDYAGAMRTLKEALQILDDIAAKYPTWNTSIVDFRRKRIIESITRLEPRVGSTAPISETIPGIPGTAQTSGGVDPIFPGDLFPTNNNTPGKAKTTTERGAKSTGGTLVMQLNQEMEELKEKERQARQDRDAAQATTRDLEKKLAKATADRNKLDEQLKVVVQRSDDAERALLAERRKKTADAEQIQILQARAAQLKKEVSSLRDERDALEELRGQETNRRHAAIERANKATQASTDFKKALDEAEKGYNVKLTAMQKKLSATEAERDGLQVKLTAVTTERDTYKSEVAKLQQNKKDLDKALADNATLMTRLSDAEKQIVQFKADNAQKDVLIADLKKEITSVNKQLEDAKTQSASYQKKMAELQANLQSTSEKLALATTTGATNATDKKRLTEENQILFGIVSRQLKGQAARDQARKLILDQLKTMQINSKDLLTRINFLGEQVVKLTPKEAALFKKPQVEVGDNEIALAAPKQESPEAATELPKPEPPVPAAPEPVAIIAKATPAPLTPPVPAATPARAVPVAKASATPAIAVATPTKSAPPAKSDTPELAMLDTSRITKPGGLEAPRNTATATPGASEPRTEPATGGNVTETGAGASTVPAELQPTALAAKDQFDRGNYRDAEKLYENILAKAPTNLYALSNLGVVRFREGKLKLAEEAFRKAIAIAPEDAFSRCTLGIIYYSQSRYDEAVNELTKSLAINPKYAAAHNFLGITASQKGWQEAAQKELETATSLDPNYADAHFNLAVVYATQQPANKENARKFYQRATELGAEKDASLEALLK